MRDFETLVRHDFFNPRTLTGAVIYGVVLLAIAWIVARALRLAVSGALARADARMIDRTSLMFVTQLVQIGIYLFALTFYAHLIPQLRTFGTALLTSVGVASVVVGFAAQNTLGNIVAGISLILYRPFEVGDTIDVSGFAGKVITVNLRYTELDAGAQLLLVPNSKLLTDPIRVTRQGGPTIQDL